MILSEAFYSSIAAFHWWRWTVTLDSSSGLNVWRKRLASTLGGLGLIYPWYYTTLSRRSNLKAGRNKISPKMFSSRLLFQRESDLNTILQSGRLFHQYLVDNYFKVESEQISYIRKKQQKRHTSDFSTLLKLLGCSCNMQDEDDFLRGVRVLIIPSTYPGCNRYMRQKMRDIVVIFCNFGHPYIFQTMTWNPNWP